MVIAAMTTPKVAKAGTMYIRTKSIALPKVEKMSPKVQAFPPSFPHWTNPPPEEFDCGAVLLEPPEFVVVVPQEQVTSDHILRLPIQLSTSCSYLS